MAISTRAELISAATEWLARDQDSTLTARIPDFITLAEAKLNRTLFVRQMEQRATTTVDTTSTDPEFITLPSDFQSMRRVRISSVTGQPRLEYMSGTQLDEFRYANDDGSDQPKYFTIIGSELELAPTPDSNYTIEMIYRKNIPALTSGNTTNWLLSLAPDLYLYGTLLEAAPYLKNDARIAVWGSGFSTARDDLNALNLTSEFNAGPATVRVSGYTP